MELDAEQIRVRIWAIILRYSRLMPEGTMHAGQPIRCTPSRLERESGKPPLSRGKIIYDTLNQAKCAAQEMFQLTGVRTSVYTCHRSTRRKHKHLTTDEEWMRNHGRGHQVASGERQTASGQDPDPGV